MEKLVIGFTAGIIIAGLSLRFKFLTKSGAAGTLLLAVVVYFSGEIKWTVPIVFFFLSSSLLSKLMRKRKENYDEIFEKSSVRDLGQVAANGLIPFLLALIHIFYNIELLFVLYVSSLAAVCADTWATETGTMFKGKTVSILNFKEVSTGQSGGISFIGTFGSLAGALMVGIVSLYFTQFNAFNFIFVVSISGLLGSIADSYAGALIQGLFRCKTCKIETEKEIHCGKETELIKGFRFINNDFVNLLASAAGVVFALLLYNLTQG